MIELHSIRVYQDTPELPPAYVFEATFIDPEQGLDQESMLGGYKWHKHFSVFSPELEYVLEFGGNRITEVLCGGIK